MPTWTLCQRFAVGRSWVGPAVQAPLSFHYTWTPEKDAWSLTGICRIYAAAWTLDRTARGVIPDERPPDKDRPVTGSELKRWRVARGWSQKKTGERLKVQHTTIARAEAKPDDPRR